MKLFGGPRLSAALSAALLALAWTAPAAAQSDFVEYYYNAGVDTHFYYSPASVTRSIVNNRQLLVKWTDDRPKGAEALVFVEMIDCDQRTSRILSVERLDAATRAFIARVDLADKSETQVATSGTMGGYLLDRVC